MKLRADQERKKEREKKQRKKKEITSVIVTKRARHRCKRTDCQPSEVNIAHFEFFPHLTFKNHFPPWQTQARQMGFFLVHSIEKYVLGRFTPFIMQFLLFFTFPFLINLPIPAFLPPPPDLVLLHSLFKNRSSSKNSFVRKLSVIKWKFLNRKIDMKSL